MHAPGKTANFTIVEEDPLAVAPMKLKDVAVWGTVFEGKTFPLAAAERKAAMNRREAVAASATAAAGYDATAEGEGCDVVGMIVEAMRR